MSEDISVQGADNLEALARRLKEAGGTELRKEMLKGIREGVKPVIPDIRKSAESILPKAGGLNDVIAKSKIGVRTRLSGENAGVSVRGTGGKQLSDMNRGRLRHPVYGNRSTWVQQSIPAGWFDKPVEKDIDKIRSSIQHVMEDVAAKIARPL